jgi:hypothetical protein
MAAKKRRHFTREYKAEVVGLFRKSGKKAGEIARDLADTKKRASVIASSAARHSKVSARDVVRAAVVFRVQCARRRSARSGARSVRGVPVRALAPQDDVGRPVLATRRVRRRIVEESGPCKT